MKIATCYELQPVPWRSFDWCATLEDYDPENDDPRGFGTTEHEAIDDLLWRLTDAQLASLN